MNSFPVLLHIRWSRLGAHVRPRTFETLQLFLSESSLTRFIYCQNLVSLMNNQLQGQQWECACADERGLWSRRSVGWYRRIHWYVRLIPCSRLLLMLLWWMRVRREMARTGRTHYTVCRGMLSAQESFFRSSGGGWSGWSRGVGWGVTWVMQLGWRLRSNFRVSWHNVLDVR